MKLYYESYGTKSCLHNSNIFCSSAVSIPKLPSYSDEEILCPLDDFQSATPTSETDDSSTTSPKITTSRFESEATMFEESRDVLKASHYRHALAFQNESMFESIPLFLNILFVGCHFR